MRLRAIHLVLISAALGSGVAYYFIKPAPKPLEEPPPVPVTQEEPEEVVEKSVLNVRSVIPPLPKPSPRPEPVVETSAPPVMESAPETRKLTPRKPTPQEQQEAAWARYWQNVKNRFNQQLQTLDQEQDPARRSQLILLMARHVRFDTLAAIDWAMNLADPEERRMAMEAINKNALVGIGAKLEMDATGYPKIQETTVMSAVGATGMVEPGDYIVGMDDGTGDPIYFDGLSLAQIVRLLRGEAGSEVRLLMERASKYGGSPQVFDVHVPRSLLVIEPPQP